MWKTSTHLAFSALTLFEKVRGGSLRLNHPDLVYRYPTHLVPPVKMYSAHMREGYGSRPVCLSVCLYVRPSVTALAASASI